MIFQNVLSNGKCCQRILQTLIEGAHRVLLGRPGAEPDLPDRQHLAVQYVVPPLMARTGVSLLDKMDPSVIHRRAF